MSEARDRFARLLHEFARSGEEAPLLAASELGRDLVNRRVPPEEIADLLARPLAELFAAAPGLGPERLAEAVCVPLGELLMGYGLAFRRQVAQEEEAAGRERLERRLRQSQRLEAVGTLAGGIAHDFNNILAAVGLYTELCLEDVPAGSRAAANLAQVLLACRRAAELVARLLAFSRSGARPEPERPLPLAPLVRESLALLAPGLPPGVALRAELGGEGPAVLATPGQIQQVVMNLVANAGQAMAAGGGELVVGIAPAGPGRVALSVRDTGPGIPPEDEERLFDPFFTTKEVGQGSGLGLSVVHGIVTDLGGEVMLENRPGQGCTFRVVLPLCAPADGPAAAGAVSLIGFHAGGRALVVEDDPAVNAAAVQLLAALGYEVAAYADAQALLADLAEGPAAAPALLFTDERMPGLNGSRLAVLLRERWPALPVVIASAGFDSEPAPLPGALRLQKPFSREQLLGALARLYGGD